MVTPPPSSTATRTTATPGSEPLSCAHAVTAWCAHPSDERFEPTSNLSHITVTAGVLHRTADGSLVDHASAVARRPRVEHRTHQQAHWPVCPGWVTWPEPCGHERCWRCHAVN
jgi:hypothetical protein